MWDGLKDFWFLFGRLFPFPTPPGLRRIGEPDRTSPVLVTCNFELTVRKLTQLLEREGIDTWLLVAPTRGENVWCAAGAGRFTTDTVVSIIRTTGIENLVDHRRLILPQLSAVGVNYWSVRDRTGWMPRFGPADMKYLPDYLRGSRQLTQPGERLVDFPLKERAIMGSNLGFNVALLSIVPLLIASVWASGLWWRTLPMLYALSFAAVTLIFWLPGKVGVKKGLSLGLIAAAMFVVWSVLGGPVAPWWLLGWTGWILALAGFVGYDAASWTPLFRQDNRELILGVRTTKVEILADKCINCHLCAVVCPVGVFEPNAQGDKYRVAHLDQCEACGACIENCPTQAIVNNFRPGQCACPTCAIINGVEALTARGRAVESDARRQGR